MNLVEEVLIYSVTMKLSVISAIVLIGKIAQDYSLLVILYFTHTFLSS